MDSLKDLMLTLDANINKMEELRSKNLFHQTEVQRNLMKINMAMEQQSQIANEQNEAIKNQNRVILKIFRELKAKEASELFCTDTDSNILKCCFDCGQRIDSMQLKLLHNHNDASEVLVRTMEKSKLQDEKDDHHETRKEDVNQYKRKNEIDDTDNRTSEDSQQGENSQTSNEQDSSLEKDSMHEQDSLSMDSDDSENDESLQRDCIDIDVTEDELLRESPTMEKERPTPKPRKRRNDSLIPKREFEKNSKSNSLSKDKTGPWNPGNRTSSQKQPISHDVLTSQRIISDIRKMDGVGKEMKIEIKKNVIKTNCLKAQKPTLLDCGGSSLPAVLEINGLPCQPYYVPIHHSERMNKEVTLHYFQFLEHNRKITQELQRCNLSQMSLFTSDYVDSEIHIKHGVIKSLFHSSTHTLGFVEVSNEVLCSFKSENRTNNLVIDVDNQYHKRILMVFPKKEKLIHYNDEIADIVLVTDGAALKQNQEYIDKIELANYKKGSNVVIVTHFEILDQKPNYKNHKEARKNRRRF